jgi:hypothetical protein
MIDEAQAIQIARDAALAEGWGFSEPFECVLRRSWFGKATRWEIRSNAGSRGTIARFVISAVDGSVLRKGYVAR